MVDPTRRDVFVWSGFGFGMVSIAVIGARILPEQSREERAMMERNAAIRAFEIHEETNNDPLASIESTDIVEEDDIVRAVGTVRNEQDDADTIAVALRVESNNDTQYGWTELFIDPGEIEEYEVTAPTEGDSVVNIDVVATDWHI